MILTDKGWYRHWKSPASSRVDFSRVSMDDGIDNPKFYPDSVRLDPPVVISLE